ncbi:transcription factor bHLH70-like [Hibiscus syriacus]|uniref:transcription factor bHLH70-like n=1 Tax=Hibiscus syriacus TaxID=106335 RepID=UPI0019204D5B|nr:transcription factor bHLH70-like [Hibiscus syriacus]
MREFKSRNISDNSVPKPAMEPDYGDEVNAESKSGAAEIEVNVINSHVNLKIQCSRRVGQVVQAIVTLESFRLTVLHLNVTSSQASVLYSFNLKMERLR